MTERSDEELLSLLQNTHLREDYDAAVRAVYNLGRADARSEAQLLNLTAMGYLARISELEELLRTYPPSCDEHAANCCSGWCKKCKEAERLAPLQPSQPVQEGKDDDHR
jgi:hypothetical protein